METEIWKDVIGYEGFYQVSNLGNVASIDRVHHYIKNGKQVASIRRWKLLSPYECKGYWSVLMCRENKPKAAQIHRLVAQSFIQNIHNKPMVNHIDGNKKNNRVENLEWVTAKENSQHSYKIGILGFGDNSSRGIIKDCQIEEIKKLLKEGKLSQEKIGRMYGVKQSTISRINMNRNRYSRPICCLDSNMT